MQAGGDRGDGDACSGPVPAGAISTTRSRLAQRVEGMRSVIAAAPGAYAINAQSVFDYAEGALFARNLHRRAGGWRLVEPSAPLASDAQHPDPPPAHLAGSGGRQRRSGCGVAPLLRVRAGGRWAAARPTRNRRWSSCSPGASSSEASAAASGWNGGRYAVWRPRDRRATAGRTAPRADVGVIAFRWRRPRDADQFSIAVPALHDRRAARGAGRRAHLEASATATRPLDTAARGSALAFAPTAKLSDELASRAASSAGCSTAWVRRPTAIPRPERPDPGQKRRNGRTQAYHVRKAGSRIW